MQKPGDPSIQSFSLPLTTLPNPTENRDSESDGLLDVVIKYRQSKLVLPQIHRVNENTTDMNTQVCLTIEVIRACGLKVYNRHFHVLRFFLLRSSSIGGINSWWLTFCILLRIVEASKFCSIAYSS
jgi:hypothetical protein